MTLDSAVARHLTNDDDPFLWDAALNTILADAARLAGNSREAVVSQIGCCRRWIRPHQIRWKAGGGFAAPFGYDPTTTGYSFRALPELDWSVFLLWTGTAWKPERRGERCLRLRIAIPGRTSRRLQAAVHTIWIPRSPAGREKLVQLYGFRKRADTWQLTAAQAVLQSRRTVSRKR